MVMSARVDGFLLFAKMNSDRSWALARRDHAMRIAMSFREL